MAEQEPEQANLRGDVALIELYKSRASIVAKIIGTNVEYTQHEKVVAMCRKELESIDALIAKHMGSFPNL